MSDDEIEAPKKQSVLQSPTVVLQSPSATEEQKPKKERTERQKEALKLAREKRTQNIQARKNAISKNTIEPVVAVTVEECESESSEEVEVVRGMRSPQRRHLHDVGRPKSILKNTKKPKKRIVYVSESSSSDSESEEQIFYKRRRHRAVEVKEDTRRDRTTSATPPPHKKQPKAKSSAVTIGEKRFSSARKRAAPHDITPAPNSEKKPTGMLPPLTRPKPQDAQPFTLNFI